MGWTTEGRAASACLSAVPADVRRLAPTLETYGNLMAATIQGRRGPASVTKAAGYASSGLAVLSKMPPQTGAGRVLAAKFKLAAAATFSAAKKHDVAAQVCEEVEKDLAQMAASGWPDAEVAQEGRLLRALNLQARAVEGEFLRQHSQVVDSFFDAADKTCARAKTSPVQAALDRHREQAKLRRPATAGQLGRGEPEAVASIPVARPRTAQLPRVRGPPPPAAYRNGLPDPQPTPAQKASEEYFAYLKARAGARTHKQNVFTAKELEAIDDETEELKLWELRCAQRDVVAEEQKMPAYEWAELRFALATSADRITSSQFGLFLDYQATAGRVQQQNLKALTKKMQKSHSRPLMQAAAAKLGLESMRDGRQSQRGRTGTGRAG